MIATSTDPPALIEHFTSRDNVAAVVAKGDTKATVLTNDGLRLDLRVVPPESYGNLLQHFTGSKEHNVALREDVRRGLLRLRVLGHEHGDRRGVHGSGRGGAYAHLGYAFIPPELRENGASSRRRGRASCPCSSSGPTCAATCTRHSTWSDGKATVEQMALAARALGHEYLALRPLAAPP